MIGPHDPRPLPRTPRPAVLLEAQRVSRVIAPARPDDCTYSAAELRRPVIRAGERRDTPRRRTRLRTGKVLNAAGRFLTDCLIYDRSEYGARLRLPPGLVLPRAILFYDDQTAVIYQADVAWRQEREAGLRIRPAVSTPQIRTIEAEMRRRLNAGRP